MGSLKDKINLSIHGCLHTVKNHTGSTTEKFDWAACIADAAIIAGLSFFGALIGTSIAGVPSTDALVAAATTAGFQFFSILALKRGLTQKQK